MSVKIDSMSDLSKYANELPLSALSDIKCRIADWLASGGDIDDDYMHQQFRYAENILNSRKE